MTVLVAGVGYIGSKVVAELLERGERVVAVDNFFATDRQAVADLATNKAMDFVEGSVTSKETIEKCLRRAKVDTIYWLAAQASAQPGAAPVRYTEMVNLLAPRLMLEAAREAGVKTIVFASSLRVHGPCLPDTVDETLSYGPLTDMVHLSNCYVEKLLEMYSQLHSFRTIVVRLGIVYGLGPVVKRDYRFTTVPNRFCLQAARGEELVVAPTGAGTLAFIHVADAARALLFAAGNESFDGFELLNAATELASPLDIGLMVEREGRALGHEVRVSLPRDLERRPPKEGSVVMASRLAEAGFNGTRWLQPTVREMLEYFAATEAVKP